MSDMSNFEVTFLTDLPALATPKASDLMLVNSDGDDKSLTLDKLSALMVNALYPVGIVAFFAQNKNPNTLFPGTTWQYLPEQKSIRIGAKSGSDVMTASGADTVTLAAGNLPAHTHTVSGSTSAFDYATKATTAFDYGTKTTNTTGNHTHTIPGNVLTQDQNQNHVSGGSTGFWTANKATAAAGNHAHTVVIGSHTHNVAIGSHTHSFSGTTSSVGNGAALNVTNALIKLMGWYRTA
ncbi:Putative phage tail fiber protein [Paramixta manurensis]|uniref:Phage tail fiber protein n=1 Tax=Paramixta manurensis TaxID=2740817 RepID=A0A6M8U7U0_9GAMM|nr:Putative phage tail fiber protein [Erwiniaceae bacterium PD-1]